MSHVWPTLRKFLEFLEIVNYYLCYKKEGDDSDQSGEKASRRSQGSGLPYRANDDFL